MKYIEMPIVSPIRYESSGNFFSRIWKWLTYTRRWKLMEDLFYVLSNGEEIFIEKGFVHDGASIPKGFRNIVSPVGVLYLAGLCHDKKYYEPEGITRKEADELFLTVANETNELTILNKICYGLLRAAGWVVWNKHRRAEGSI
jgi:hypothetical protein